MCIIFSWFGDTNQKLGKLVFIEYRGRRDRDRMVVGFTITYTISAYHY